MYQPTRDFTADLKNLDWLSPEPFALVRFGDGERAILGNSVGATSDGWTQPTEDFRLALEAALLHESHDYFIGISCPCCDESAHRKFKTLFMPDREHRLTYSNLFANANWVTFLEKCKASPPRSVGYVGPYLVEPLPKFLYPVAWVPKNLVNDPHWSEKIDRVVDKMEWESANGPLFVSAGPAAKIIVQRFWKLGNRQVTLDIGSALDHIIHGKPNRGYQYENHVNRTKICRWST